MDELGKDDHDTNIRRTDSYTGFGNQPIIVENISGEVRIQLEGSHTTTSETDPNSLKAGSCVRFSDHVIDLSCSGSQCVPKLPKQSTANFSSDVVDVNKKPDKPMSAKRNLDLDLLEIEKENEAIGQRFQQIMDMFDAFTRNLETLELQTTSPIRGLSENDKRKESIHSTTEGKNSKLDPPTSSTFALHDETDPDRNSVSTTTSVLDVKYQNTPCQTSIQEDFSIGQASMLHSASGTSRSDLQHSLNNYARSDNAMKITFPAEGHPLKTTQHVHNIPAVVVEEPCSQPFNTIHIETMSTTSSSALRRPPLCQRLWDVVTDFCAAICLCLQVNRDCIFCLGFFAAFVVSASFLTAFFYRTLSVSPPLWQSPPNRYLHNGPGMIGGYNPRRID